MILLYRLFLWFYKMGIYVVSAWNKKAALWIKGRKNIFKELQSSFQDHSKKTVWMHCASLGEFEQGRPVLQKIKAAFPDVRILITFFSPSGYEIIKPKKDFENVFYLPMDSFSNARKFLNIVKPDLILWVKYEYWHYYLLEIKKRNLPLYMVSGVYRNNQVFFKWYGGFYRNMLQCFTHFFVQNLSSKVELQKVIAEDKITVTGDTRCDRVINIAEDFTGIEGIAAFCGNHTVIVAGSTWEDDEAEWIHFVKKNPEIKFIIAPHEIDEENLSDVKKNFTGSVFYSEWMKKQGMSSEKQVASSEKEGPNCLIIDNIGMLSRLYHYATIAYVGGGFGADGLHNILEAAVYGKPVIFGPEHQKNFEAQELIDCSGAISIQNALGLEKVVNHLLAHVKELEERGREAKNYIYKNAGAAEKILSYINPDLNKSE